MKRPNLLTNDEIENIEKLSLRALHLAVCEFGFEAWSIFNQSDDEPKDIAEDVTREMMDRLGGYSGAQRIYGNVDYRKARFVVLPNHIVRQALFVDSKAEKSSANATLQMSQVSMSVRQTRGGGPTDISGQIKPISKYDGLEYLSTILIAHFFYEVKMSDAQQELHNLKRITLAAVPNGKLQDFYNPDETDTIWMAGRNAPSRGEDFRVRLNFNRLAQKTRWRVQVIDFDSQARTITSQWTE
jgi:Type II restriction enzyme SfiI